MKKIIEILGNPALFATLYILFMIPTYYLPYVGSNSAVVGVVGQMASEAGGGPAVSPQFWLHLISLIVLVVITWFRGSAIDKKWLVILPIIATVFDLAPGLNLIPLIPTIMHVIVLILGVKGATAIINEQQTVKNE